MICYIELCYIFFSYACIGRMKHVTMMAYCREYPCHSAKWIEMKAQNYWNSTVFMVQRTHKVAAICILIVQNILIISLYVSVGLLLWKALNQICMFVCCFLSASHNQCVSIDSNPKLCIILGNVEYFLHEIFA